MLVGAHVLSEDAEDAKHFELYYGTYETDCEPGVEADVAQTETEPHQAAPTPADFAPGHVVITFADVDSSTSATPIVEDESGVITIDAQPGEPGPPASAEAAMPFVVAVTDRADAAPKTRNEKSSAKCAPSTRSRGTNEEKVALYGD